MDDRAFLGVGWRFPVNVDEATGRVRTSSHDDDIAEAIRIILHTKKGERVMRPDFGSTLHSYAFESGALTSLSLMADEIKNNLVLWEPRIQDVEVSADGGDSGVVNISVSYVVRSTNNPYNLVFPFYIKEGS